MRSRNHKEDWTDVLRERLQDARLPLDESPDFIQKTLAVSGQPRQNTGGYPEKRGVFWTTAWPWVLSGIAAVLAAVLFLRTAREPDPSLLIRNQLPPTPAATQLAQVQMPPAPLDTAARTALAQDAGQTGLPAADILPSTLSSARTATSSFADLIGESLPEELPALGQEDKRIPSSKQAENEDVPANNEDEILRQAREFFRDEPAPATQRRRRGPVSLRVQAGYAGSRTMTPGTVQLGYAASADPARPLYYLDLNGTAVLVANGGPGEVPGSGYSQSDPLTPQTPQESPVANDPSAHLINSTDREVPFVPVSFGVAASLPLSLRWALSAGLDYTQRPGALFASLSAGATLFERRKVTLHYLGIPVDAHFLINPDNRLRVYLGAGVKMEKCIAVTGASPLPDPLLFSANLQAGVDFRILPGIRLYVAPGLSQYLNRSAYLNNWDQSPQFSIRAGFSFDLK